MGRGAVARGGGACARSAWAAQYVRDVSIDRGAIAQFDRAGATTRPRRLSSRKILVARDLHHAAALRSDARARAVHSPRRLPDRDLSRRVQLRTLAGRRIFLEQDRLGIHADVDRGRVVFPGARRRRDLGRSSSHRARILTANALECSGPFRYHQQQAKAASGAAGYRLVAHHGWDDGIYNHCSMRVPGEDRKLLMKQHELLWTEVTASNLVKVSMDEDLDERAGVNRPGFTLHGGVLRGRADVNCAVHVHTRTGMAIAGLKSGLRMISQESVRFFGSLGYHPYEGITEDFGERERLIAHLGNNRAMILQNHGVLTVGKTARDAFILMKHLLEAAEIQLAMEATGGELIEIPPEICKKTVQQYEKHDSGRGSADWPAYLRMLDRIDPSYRT